jgi:UDP:flavonoid glycosyltransferase YjiC (YdhE family)
VLIAASTARSDEGLVPAALDAVGAMRARAILTAPAGAIPASLPPGVVACPFADHDAILPRCAAVVCNGGHGIVARALTHGVPLVVRPGHGDQRENGYRVERAGAGLRVLDPRSIGAALRRVLGEPRFAARAAALAVEAASMDGPGTAARLVEELAEQRAGR